MKPTYKEIERQLSESRREFWAADATINNLELKLAEMAAQLGHAEKRIAELESSATPQLPQTEVLSAPDGVLKSLLPDAEKPDFWFEHNGKIFFEGVRFNNAVFEACRAAMLQGSEPETDTTNQQFESLSRGDK